MKYFITIPALLLIIVVSYTSAQWQSCHNRTWMPTCLLPGSRGQGGRGCPAPAFLWYYDRNTKQCRSMLYMGCGGNNNRWCSRAICQKRCRNL